MDLPPSASSPLRGRRSRFGFQYRVSADWITQCPLSVWVDAPTVGPDIEAIGLPGVRHATSSYTVRLQLPSVTTVGYRDSLSYACSSPSGHPSSRFAVRYVHEFCLMLLPDAPSLRLPLPCWCSPSVRSRWLSFLQLACHARHTKSTAASGARIRELIIQGKLDILGILGVIRREYRDSNASSRDVSWNRWQLKTYPEKYDPKTGDTIRARRVT